MALDQHSPPHPILGAVAVVRSALKEVADANPTFMSTTDKADALREVVAAEAQLAELRLRIMADAGDVAGGTAAKDAAGWLAQHTRTRFDDARADLALAEALDRDRPVLAGAMRAGEATLAQAHVIRRSLDALPATVDVETTTRAEAHLVAQAAEFGPKELGRIGRRILDVVAPEIADAADAARLADLEAHAADMLRLSLRRLGDGTTRISGRVPDSLATRFAIYLEGYANPRRAHGAGRAGSRAVLPEMALRGTPAAHPAAGTAAGTAAGAVADPAAQPAVTGTAGSAAGTVADATIGDPVARAPYPRKLGQAFAAFLEGIDPGRLPLHGGDATTVIVTIPIDGLRAELASADLIGGGLVPGDDLAGDRLTADQARRLACTAKILPAVLGGESVPLDLGRARRLFSSGQRKALAIRDRTCRAEGCDIPATWCEAHHLHPWSHGGRTDIRDGILYCSHHHHRAHDAGYETERLASGDTRFHRRR